MSLLHRLLLLVCLSLVPAAIIEVKNELTLRQSREEEVKQGALRLAALFEAEQDRTVEGLRQLVATLVVTDAVRAPRAPACQAFMDALQPSYPSYLLIHVVDLNGDIRCATDRAALGLNVGERTHFREAVETGRFIMGGHVRQRVSGRLALPVAMPFRDNGGAVAGVVTALIDIAWIEEFLSRKSLPPKARVTLVDRSNTIIAQTPPIPGRIGRPLKPEIAALMDGTDEGVTEMDGLDGETRIVAYRPTKMGLDGIGVLVGLDRQEALGPIREAMTRALSGLAAVLALTLLAAWWGGHRMVRRPVAALVEAARQWTGGNLSARSGVGDERSELGTLARAFDGMAEELERQHIAREAANAMAHKMAAVLGSVTDGVFEVDRDWRIVFMNDRARALLADGRNLVGRVLWDAFPEVEASLFGDRYRQAMLAQVPVEFEGLYRPLDSWFGVRAFPSPEGLAIFLQDITARKRGEEALAFANREKSTLLAQLNGLLENAPVGLAFFDRQHRYLRINKTLCEINGIPPEDHIGRSIRDLLPFTAASVEPLIDRVFLTGQGITYQEVVGETPAEEGVRRHWLTALFPVLEGPDVVAAGAVVMEVSDLRRAEAARHQSEERFRSVFELAAVGIERVALDGHFLDVNAKLCSILGYRRDELLDRTYRDITDPEDHEAEEALIDRLLGGDLPSYAIEKRYRRKDGGRVWVRVTSSLARITGVEMAYRISIVEDITERKAIEEELRAAKDDAERANLAKSKFLAAASHDLRQPLQSLFFFAAALAGHLENTAGIHVLRHLEQGLDALKGLLDSLLDVSRLDAGVVTPVIETFDINEVMDQIRTAYAPLAAEKGLEWRVESCVAQVRSDRTLLARLMRNLVENALRYTQDGLVRVQCRVDGPGVAVVVQDTGMGIPPDHLDRIFEEFHQVGNPERDRTQGLGLGLAIVRRLSRLLDHPVDVRSVEGRGSAFRVIVPLGEPLAIAAQAPMARIAGRGNGRMAVLVDDDAIVLMGLQMILTEWGYTVVAAGSADQAMDKLGRQSQRPDIVIADYRLRENRVGTEVVLRVRERYGATVPGVILTGETGTDCLRDASTHGLRVIHKPVTPRELGEAVEQQLKVPTA